MGLADESAFDSNKGSAVKKDSQKGSAAKKGQTTKGARMRMRAVTKATKATTTLPEGGGDRRQWEEELRKDLDAFQW